MNRTRRFEGTARMLNAAWPRYAAAYAGLIALLLLVALLLQLGRFGWALLSLLAFGALAYLLGAALVGLYQLYDQRDVADELFRLSQARPSDRVAAVDVGERVTAFRIMAQLTSGKMHLLDIYHPQLTPSRTLLKLREQAPRADNDPRITVYDCPIDLLPLPNDAVSAVYLPQILSTFAQSGDRLILLEEVHRILKPEGRLVMAERCRTRLNWLTAGPLALQFEPIETWRDLLTSAGFQVRREFDAEGRLTLIRADKPSPEAGRQLSLNLPYL